MAESKERRHTDGKRDEIEMLIKAENDPERRALLIVLQAINNSLIANTATVNEIDDQLKLHLAEFRKHAEDEHARENEDKGKKSVINYVFSVVQAACVAGVGYVATELKQLHQHDVSLEAKILVLETYHKTGTHK
jgi:hypothetical protein